MRQAQPRFQQKVNITATQPLSAWRSTTTTRSCYDVQAVAQKHCRRPPPMNSVITSTNPHMCRVAVRLRLRARIPSFNRSKDSRLFFVGADDNRALITQSTCRETSAFVFFFLVTPVPLPTGTFFNLSSTHGEIHPLDCRTGNVTWNVDGLQILPLAKPAPPCPGRRGRRCSVRLPLPPCLVQPAQVSAVSTLSNGIPRSACRWQARAASRPAVRPF